MNYAYIIFISLFTFSRIVASDFNNTNYAKEKVDYSEWESLLSSHITADGRVNYVGFKKDEKKLDSFLNKLSKTQITSNWSKKDKISYWVNVYNAFTVKLIVTNLPTNSIKDLKSPWKQKFFKINGTSMSLGHVEHEILRKFDEPRIHFAINCASYSCPRLIQIPYTSENLERLLEKQTAEYINNSDANNITESYYKLSQIFSWFSSDFKTNCKSVKDFINKYSTIKIDEQSNKGYLKYNWSLNSL